MIIDKTKILKNVPDGLRNPLISEFDKIVRNYRESRWEPAELNGGKLCEIVYSITKGFVDGKYPSIPSKPPNMVDACKALENADAAKFSRSVRIQIPRIIMGLYEIRNNRGVGHVGSDVDPNEMDAAAVLSISKWLMAELIRIFHGLSTVDATKAVSLITERTIPIVWEIDGKRRILNDKLSQKNKTLLLLYSCHDGATESELVEWTEHSNASVYRRDVLKKLHKERFLEYPKISGNVKISPKGISYVEKELELEFSN